ncbi:ROK family transcriptional regulator [Herbiconiux sp. CPCC 205716]|uniref:ROK family transcriptional regulator n=1 Tax=Herbiconiux gentiana TaxID=2970912 RepID=A0ABT2GHM9_9MICO|nr:ROK family transcriptional regulator [Herbiconiux gentiana]MCS5715732.1 ROK family transcriptional regulator [Herbiconiux gentiana]
MRTHVGEVLALFREHGELSRTEVIDISGLSRSTVNQRLAALESAGLIAEIGGGESTGGRPSSRFALNRSRGVLLTADIGATGLIAAVCDLAGSPLRHRTVRVDVWEGPERVLGEVDRAFDELIEGDLVWGIGIGVPGPVEFAAGRVVNPPIMTGWDRFDIAGWFDRFEVPVVVENDANSRAVAEARPLRHDNLISMKVGTGIGSGLVFNGQIIRGSEGAAGDIGHTRAALADSATPLGCRCGNVGCVEAYAGGWALVRDLDAAGTSVEHVADVVTLVRQGDIEAVRLVRQAGRVLGDAVADLVSILNPESIVLSGQLAECGEVLLSGVRERVYQRSLPLATRNLTIRVSKLGELAGVTGLAIITADQLFATDRIDELLERIG